jgi:hypothetical protein
VPNTRGKATNSVPTLLYFHGNAGSTPRTPPTFSDQRPRARYSRTVPNADLSFRLPNVKHLVATVGTNVLIVSYRGCVYSPPCMLPPVRWC